MFVGLDAHKKYAEVAILDENGAVRKQVSDPKIHYI